MREPAKSRVGLSDNSRARYNRSEFDRGKVDNGEIGGGKVKDDKVGKKVQELSKSKKTMGSDFFTFGARLVFTKLRQVFIKAPTLYHFDLERHIRIETDVLGYTIDGDLNQLTLDDLGQWHLVTFFLQNMIPVRTSIKLMIVSF